MVRKAFASAAEKPILVAGTILIPSKGLAKMQETLVVDFMPALNILPRICTQLTLIERAIEYTNTLYQNMRPTGMYGL